MQSAAQFNEQHFQTFHCRYDANQTKQIVLNLVDASASFSVTPEPDDIYLVRVKPDAAHLLPEAVGAHAIAERLKAAIGSLSLNQIVHDHPTYVDFDDIVRCHDAEAGARGDYTGLRLTVVVQDGTATGWYFQLLISHESHGWDESLPVPQEDEATAAAKLKTFQEKLDTVACKPVPLLEDSCSHKLMGLGDSQLPAAS